MFNSRFKVLLWAVLVLAIVAAGLWSFIYSVEPKSTLEFRAFDIGQGDSIFIETPDRYQILIDGGPDGSVIQKLGSVLSFWDRSIDLVVLTHPHADHVAGLIDVLKRYKVGAVIESNVKYSTSEYAEWDRLKSENHIPSYSAASGMRAAVGKYAVLDILAPVSASENESSKNVHDDNVISLLRFGSQKFLLMGDGEVEEERQIMSRGLLGQAGVLKVGHHGSRTSSSAGFLEAVSPKYAVISVGAKNRYGHPHQEIIDRLQAVGAKILRTDQDGDVVIKTDGASLVSGQ